MFGKATGTVPSTPQRIIPNSSSKTIQPSSTAIAGATASKRNTVKAQLTAIISTSNKSDVVPVIVPRTNARLEQEEESRKEVDFSGRTIQFSLQPKATDFRRFSNSREFGRPTVSALPETSDFKASGSSGVCDRNNSPVVKSLIREIPESERNTIYSHSIGFRRSEVNSMNCPPSIYQHESCMYLLCKRLLFGCFLSWSSIGLYHIKVLIILLVSFKYLQFMFPLGLIESLGRLANSN